MIVRQAPITSRSNVRVKALRASFSGNASRPGDLLGLEGEHLIAEAIRSAVEIETLFIREGSESVLERPSLAGAEANDIVILSYDVFASAVETASPQGIAATIGIPRPQPVAVHANSIVLILESLRDPGNVGTLIRSSEAFGAQQIFVTPDTANQWNPKVVRASAGSVFRVPILRTPLHQIASELSEQGTTIYAAVVQRLDSGSLLDTRFAPNCAVIIGNEGSGLSSEALAIAHHRVRIPCAVESLNAAVAGSALLFEVMRQRSESLRPEFQHPDAQKHPTEAAS